MRRKNDHSPAEVIVMTASYMPWWVCILLALISFFIFNAISNIPEQAVEVGKAGNHLGREAMRIFGFFAKIVVPGLLVIAGIASGARKVKGEEEDAEMKKIAYIMTGVLSVFLLAFLFLFSMVGRNAGNMIDNINKNAEANMKKVQENQQSQR